MCGCCLRKWIVSRNCTWYETNYTGNLYFSFMSSEGTETSQRPDSYSLKMCAYAAYGQILNSQSIFSERENVYSLTSLVPKPSPVRPGDEDLSSCT